MSEEYEMPARPERRTDSVRSYVRQAKPIVGNATESLAKSGPEKILRRLPKISKALYDGTLRDEDIREVAEQYRDIWGRAVASDISDASISAVQLGTRAATAGAEYVTKPAVELLEMIPKARYLYSYAQEAGYLPAALLSLYEALSVFDPTEALDLLPAYMASTIYLMRKKVLERIEPGNKGRPIIENVAIASLIALSSLSLSYFTLVPQKTTGQFITSINTNITGMVLSFILICLGAWIVVRKD